MTRWMPKVGSGAGGANTTPPAASWISRPSRQAGRSGPDSSLGSRLDPHSLRGGHFWRSGPWGVDALSCVGAASQDRALVVNDLEAVGLDPAPSLTQCP